MTDNEILELTPELPKNFTQLCESLFDWKEYFFTYKDEIKDKFGYCTHCKTTVNLELGRTVTLDNIIAYQNKHNDYGVCPNCGSKVQWKDSNRGRRKLHEENYLYYFTVLESGDLLLRTFYVLRDFGWGDKTSPIKLSEHYRIFFIDGQFHRFIRKIIYTFDERTEFFTTSCEDSSYQRVKRISTPVPWQSRRNSFFNGYIKSYFEPAVFGQNSKFKYSCIQQFEKTNSFLLPVEYLNFFQQNPSLCEKLVKQEFSFLIVEKFRSSTNSLVNWKKKTVYEALGLDKGDIRAMNEKSVKEILKAQAMKRGVTKKNAEWLVSEKVYSTYEANLIARLLKDKHINGNELIKYFKKNKVLLSDYRDYLNQLRQLKIPKTNTALFPKDFMTAHNNLSAEFTRRANEQKKAKALELQKKFENKYKILDKNLSYENDDFKIRPAKGDFELLAESTVLGHCVYSNYRNQYRNGNTIICLVRKKTDIETPFYTLELSTDYSRIIQCRTKGNQGMTDEVRDFTNEWFEWLHSDSKEKENEKKCQKTTAA